MEPISEVDLYGQSLLDLIYRSLAVPAELLNPSPDAANYSSTLFASNLAASYASGLLASQFSKPEPVAEPIDLEDLKRLLGGDGASMQTARFDSEGGFSLN